MSSIIPIAYYTGVTIPDGTSLQGNLIIGNSAQDYGAFPNGYRFWATTDLDLGYCIAIQVPAGNQPNPLNIPCYVGFFSTAPSFDDQDFLNLANYVTNYSQGFVDPTTAADWLNNNGYFTNYGYGRYRVLYWDIQNNSSYPGSGSTITDLLGRSNGSLVGSIPFTSGSPKYLTVNGSSSTYLITNTGLGAYMPDTQVSYLLWVYPTANGVIVSEIGQFQIDNGWHDAQVQMVGGTLRFDVWSYDNTNFTGIQSSVATPFNNWYMIGLTYDGTTLRAYVNGQLAGSKVKGRGAPGNLYYALAAPDKTNLSGLGNAGGVAGSMRFGSFEVYNYGLTGAQVQSKFNATKSQYGL